MMILFIVLNKRRQPTFLDIFFIEIKLFVKT
jgi:hypothetical protein